MLATLSRITLAFLLALFALPWGSVADAAPKEVDDAGAIDLFDAMKDGKIEANLILKDAKKGNLLIKNKGKQPLKIRMPGGFAGKPVLGQFAPGGLGGGGLGGLGGGGGGINQGVGGGGVMPGGLGGGLFNVAPEQL